MEQAGFIAHKVCVCVGGSCQGFVVCGNEKISRIAYLEAT